MPPRSTPRQWAQPFAVSWASPPERVGQLLARPRTFELTTLARLLCDSGELDQAVRVGHQAVDLAAQIRSQRVVDRFAPLLTSLRGHLGAPTSPSSPGASRPCRANACQPDRERATARNRRAKLRRPLVPRQRRPPGSD